MKLSVIIVNYNVRAYLEQCLRTVFEALEGVDGDVFVVDNQSTDGSVEMVREKFPGVRLIANKENVGFSRANNQAIRESSAEYVLLLNPDTVVGEDVFRTVITFMDKRPACGGLGVKMIDGAGRFLPESKRGLPTPAVAFYKIIGLTRLFPRSKVFGRYHLGHLPENGAAPIEILSGACMFLRKRTLDEVGLLDESFFMYGEDIDLSYRITMGGYENWYLPEARIIHYKGESTKKSSVNYVFVFYNAMAIFAKKHFTRKRPDVFAGLINGSIYLSAAGAIVTRFLRRALLPMLDVLMVSILLIAGQYMLGGIAPDAGKLRFFVATGAGCALLSAFFGVYDLPVRLINVLKAVAAMVLVGGGVWLLNGQDRTQGLMVGYLVAVCGISLVATRLLLHLFRVKPFTLRALDRKRVLAIGSAEESQHALALLWQTHFGLGRQQQMDPKEANAADAVEAIRKKIRKHGIDEVVFCAKDLAWGRIVELMERLKRTRVMFKIAQPAREFIIGPSSIESVQDLLIMEEHAVSSSAARRRKRILDVAVSCILLLLLPITIWFVRDKSGFLGNIVRVLRGSASWVGYFPHMDQGVRLPRIRPGILDPVRADGLDPVPLTVHRVNLTYAKDYRTGQDLRLIWRGFAGLGG
ncbi:MAG TPA: glycosyltransferase family 2 protein [Flavobacteriales bacterium]|nr:glycosyltransferase family 2 protein [Flavobacteriales bacterium]HNK68697.1 glycosyltransferase family 2 protein [Flavobacteriales bacterium]